MPDDVNTKIQSVTSFPGIPVSDLPAAPPGYELRGELARGGMGVIYTARDRRLDREVALKCVQGQFGEDPRSTARFLAEAQITGRLEHPGVPPVHELGTLPDGRPFLAMKLIHGHTLTTLLSGRPNPGHDLPRFVHIFEQIANTVGFAHSKAIIHRDLKPANVMVGAFGEVQVMDWGLAKVLSHATSADSEETLGPASPPDPFADTLTQAGAVLGTPAYMAPEQARGEVNTLDARADVFGLGAILCAILTGQPPFGGENALSTLRLAAAADLAATHTRLAACGADPELVALCRRCLAADPADRPSDGEAVAAAVASYREGVEDRLREAEVARAEEAVKVNEERRRRKLQLALAGAVVAALALVGAGAWFLHTQQQQSAADAAVRTAQARAAVEAAAEQADAAVQAGRLADADAALRVAESRLADAGSDELQTTVAGLRADADTYRLLDEAVERRWAVSGEKTNVELARPGFKTAFTRLGLDVGVTPAAEVGAAVAASRIRGRLVAGLDEWLESDPAMPGLVDALKAADPDPFRSACRAALAAKDLKALRELVRKADPAVLPPSFVASIATPTVLRAAEVVQLLQAAAARHPSHFPLAMAAGAAAINPQTREAVDEGLGYFRAAIALRPDNARARLMLATAYGLRGDHESAIASAREATRLAPAVPRVHASLGGACREAGRLTDAEAAFRKAFELATEPPAKVLALTGLSEVYYARTDYRASEAVLREAVALLPNDPTALSYLADALEAQGRLDEALKAFRDSVRGTPETGYPFYRVGLACFQRGLYREAVEYLSHPLIDEMPLADDVRTLLRQALVENGEFARAAELLKQTVAHTAADNPGRQMADFLLRQTELAVKYAAAIDAGTVPFKRDGSDDLVDVFLFADVARIKGRPTEAVAWYEYGFQMSKKSPYDVATGFKPSAARAAMAAALAAPAGDRPRYRGLALEWLAGEPDRLVGRFAAAPPAPSDQRLTFRKAAWFLLADPAFRPVREGASELPPEERARWESLWARLRWVGETGSQREQAPAPRSGKP